MTRTICTSALTAASKVFKTRDGLNRHWTCSCGSIHCKKTADWLLTFVGLPSVAAAATAYKVQITGKTASPAVSKPIKRAEKPAVKAITTAQLLVVDNETLNLVNSVKYPLDSTSSTYERSNLLKGVITVHKAFSLLKALGYEPVLATPMSVMDLGLASDIAIKWKGGWRLLQVKSSVKGAEKHFKTKGEGFSLHTRISALLPAIASKKRWECPECLIIVNGRLVCLNANGRGSYFPPALRSDNYVVEKYNW